VRHALTPAMLPLTEQPWPLPLPKVLRSVGQG